MKSMSAANKAHEAFVKAHCHAVRADQRHKRQRMTEGAFEFLRATCFRFAERFAELAPEVTAQPAVPSVGDAHLENFGTWRDAEGRLVWGVNDLDEAALLPWPTDLLRLATSALLAPGAPDLQALREALLEGYAEGLAEPRPFILDERHALLREAAIPRPDERQAFWKKIDKLEPGKPDRAMRAALIDALPDDAGPATFAPRRAGLGSLGRPRFVAIAEWRGGRVVREAKARLPSAWIEAGFPGAHGIDVPALAQSPARAPDPWLVMTDRLVLRRLAPDSRKLELQGANAEVVMIRAMAGELANIHAAGGQARSIARALAGMRPKRWLEHAAARLRDAVEQDFAEWQRVMAG